MIVKITEDIKESLTIKLPKFVVDKIELSIEKEINRSDINYDPFGFSSECNRTYKSNIVSFRDRVYYIVSRIYNQLSYRKRYNCRVLCTDFSEKQLSNLLGDCTRNRTKIGWQSIKKFLLDNDIIIIADNLFIHDSYLNKPQSIAYSISEFDDLTHKPIIKTSKSGRVYSSSKDFKVEELELKEYTITNKSLLRSIAKDSVIEIDTDTVAGHQWELLTKYSANELDRKFVTNCISGEMGNKYLFHESKNTKGKAVDCKLISVLSKPNHSYSDFRVRQSVYSSRIFTPITSARKYARSFINFNDKDNIFAEFDMKSSQIVLAAFLYHKQMHNMDSKRVLELVVRNDIYEMISAISPKRNKKGINIGHYTREEMKKFAFKSIFSIKDYSENPFSEGLKKLFPEFYKFIDSQKTHSKQSKLAIKLQRLESMIFVGNYGYNYKTRTSKESYPMPFTRKSNKCILGELYRLGIDAFSIHDAILVNVSQVAKLYSIDVDDVSDLVISPIIYNVFRSVFGSECFDETKKSWVFGLVDESDSFTNEFRKNVGEMKLFTRCDNFNQFSSKLFDKIDKKYNTRLTFYSYKEYVDFVNKGDFRRPMYDEPDEGFWDTHDKNSPEYSKYFESIDDCPF